MSAPRNLKFEILQLRQKGHSYRKIQSILNCTRSTVHYHCKKNNLLDMGQKRYPVDSDTKKNIHQFCKNKKIKDAIKAFNLSYSTIYKYKNLQVKQDDQKETDK